MKFHSAAAILATTATMMSATSISVSAKPMTAINTDDPHSSKIGEQKSKNLVGTKDRMTMEGNDEEGDEGGRVAVQEDPSDMIRLLRGGGGGGNHHDDDDHDQRRGLAQSLAEYYLSGGNMEKVWHKSCAYKKQAYKKKKNEWYNRGRYRCVEVLSFNWPEMNNEGTTKDGTCGDFRKDWQWDTDAQFYDKIRYIKENDTYSTESCKTRTDIGDGICTYKEMLDDNLYRVYECW